MMADKTAEALWRNVDQSGGPDACWPWVGRVGTPERHVYRKFNGKTRSVHSVAWEVTNGPIPEGQVVCHRCDNPPCCNPAHLFVGTQADNLQDMTEKGRRFYRYTAEQVAEVRAATGEIREIAARLGMGKSQVHNIRSGKQRNG
jgi:hypothetical protein